MLLRSSSAPVLRTRFQISKETHNEHAFASRSPCKRSAIFCSSASDSTSFDSFRNASEKMIRAASETDLRTLSSNSPVPKAMYCLPPDTVEESEEEADNKYELHSSSLDRLFSSSGLDELVSKTEETALATLTAVGSSAGGSGRVFGGKGGRGDYGGRGYPGNSEYNRESLDAYYRGMIEANPESSLLHANYAKFLKEERGDLVKAEEYCGRAILANPHDGDVLALYGSLLWESHKDAERAESYFNQAIKAAPGNSYVMAAYARFLWDANEDEGENQEPVCLIKGEGSHIASSFASVY